MRHDSRQLTHMTNTALKNKPAFPLLAWGAAAVAVVWSFWPTLLALSPTWLHDPGYSHGILVPGFALYLLWLRRDRLQTDPPMLVPGVVMLLVAAGLRFVGGTFIFDWFDAIALLPALIGITM